MQCCTDYKWVHLRCSQLSLSNSELLAALTVGASPCCVPTRNTVTLSSDSSDMYTSLYNLALRLIMLYFLPTLVFKPLIPHRLILYLLPGPLASGCSSTPPASSPLTLSGFFNGMLKVLEPGVLNYLLHFLSSHPVDLICIQESYLKSSSFFWIFCSAF